MGKQSNINKLTEFENIAMRTYLLFREINKEDIESIFNEDLGEIDEIKELLSDLIWNISEKKRKIENENSEKIK